MLYYVKDNTLCAIVKSFLALIYTAQGAYKKGWVLGLNPTKNVPQAFECLFYICLSLPRKKKLRGPSPSFNPPLVPTPMRNMYMQQLLILPFFQSFGITGHNGMSKFTQMTRQGDLERNKKIIISTYRSPNLAPFPSLSVTNILLSYYVT